MFDKLDSTASLLFYLVCYFLQTSLFLLMRTKVKCKPAQVTIVGLSINWPAIKQASRERKKVTKGRTINKESTTNPFPLSVRGVGT